ncbi:hypothetical protein HO173_006158 [Letharia columbiana]|uniref:Rhodopsin domain-containing protein n=1 Tax=Letharia columbiana TaxID=112416 RepID=A0A8H6L4N6_9LECA|nr:uncharacterized protein HO173_006158 [Letharia columbiana]KAF6235475.1 hypothetical protein HO173_006158 [Letharia columbiana]
MDTQLLPASDGNQNRTGQILGACLGFLVMSCIFVTLRLYTRLFLIKSARWDDWTIVLALLGSIVGVGLDFPEIHYGFGRHQYYLNDHQVQEFKKYIYGEWIQTFFTLMITKVSICLLLLRISPNKRIERPIQGLVAFLVLSNIVLSLVWILQCIPVDGAWDAKRQKTARCFTQGQVQRVLISQAIISIISDFILAGFPIIIIRNARIHFRQKILLCSLMGVGLLTAACCIVRTVINWQNDHIDPTWVSVDNFLWRDAEVNIGIAAACLPTLLPLYRLLRDKIIATREGSTSTTGRFTHFFSSGRGRKPNASSQEDLWRSRKEYGLPIPPNAEWASSTSQTLVSFGRMGDEDVEMQTPAVALH